MFHTMEISIYYQGKLNHPELVAQFSDELADIARAMEWGYILINEQEETFNIKLRGIKIFPHKKTEPLIFTFDPDGYIRNPSIMKVAGNLEKFTYIGYIETHHTTAKFHIKVAKLLKYIQKKYISNLDVSDGGGYWETENNAVVKERFDAFKSQKNYLQELIKSIYIEEGGIPESIAKKYNHRISTIQSKRAFRNRRRKK